MKTEAEKRLARTTAIRNRDADRLEAALGPLPVPIERPSLLILVGLPGSGKSHLARALAARYPAAILDSDALRGVLFEEPKHTENEHRRLFPAMHTLIDRLLGRAITVIVDATNLKEAHRRPYYKIAEKHGARVVLVQVTAPRRVIRERLAGRSAAADPLDRSTATLEVFENMKGDAERITKRHIRADTSRDLGPVLDKIVALLQS
jgi:predicted kinase